MSTLELVPKKDDEYFFYANDQIKLDTEYKAFVKNVYTYSQSERIMLPKYDLDLQEIIDYPLLDLWIESVNELFWILAESTDYIIELKVPSLCPSSVYVARDIDGGWHSFEIYSSKEFGILDVTGKLHKMLSNTL